MEAIEKKEERTLFPKQQMAERLRLLQERVAEIDKLPRKEHDPENVIEVSHLVK